jgi:hypothetical protein
VTDCKRLNFCYQNTRGLRTKSLEVFASFLTTKYDAYLITETWLHEGFLNNELFPDDYEVIRCDRNSETCAKKRGGGALLAIRNEHTVKKSNVFNTKFIQSCWVETRFYGQPYFVCVVYIAPSAPVAQYREFYDFINACVLTMESETKFLLCGDFNRSNFYECTQFSLCTDTFLNDLTNFTAFHNLSQWNAVLNKNGRLLDLVFASVPLQVSHCQDPIVCEDVLHPCLLLQLDVKKHKIINDQVLPDLLAFESYCFRKTNHAMLYNCIQNIDFSPVMCSDSISKSLNLFYEKLFVALDDSVPKKSFSSNSRYPPLFLNVRRALCFPLSSEIRCLLNQGG